VQMGNAPIESQNVNRNLGALDGVTFAYNPSELILDNVSLELPTGAIVSVVGPSGCGKSTLLSIVAGIQKADSGAVHWSDEAIAGEGHRISMMFQADTLLPWLTVVDNIGLFYRFSKRKVPRAERRRRVGELIELAGLHGAEHFYPYQLSGGMRRRTAFLAAVAPGPRILLLDEPFSSLDEPTRIGIHQDIFNIVKANGMTVLLVTHDIAEAISLSDKVIVLTARPATVATQFDVRFGEERKMLELRDDPAFLKLYGAVWEALTMQIQRSDNVRSKKGL
jgi:NitT/TauT family transport system ATP-binding protein